MSRDSRGGSTVYVVECSVHLSQPRQNSASKYNCSGDNPSTNAPKRFARSASGFGADGGGSPLAPLTTDRPRDVRGTPQHLRAITKSTFSGYSRAACSLLHHQWWRSFHEHLQRSTTASRLRGQAAYLRRLCRWSIRMPVRYPGYLLHWAGVCAAGFPVRSHWSCSLIRNGKRVRCCCFSVGAGSERIRLHGYASPLADRWPSGWNSGTVVFSSHTD